MAYDLEPMLELFIYETNQQIDTLEKACIDVEDAGTYNPEAINEIFRGMHTIKGSAGMMMYDQVSSLAHALEDLFDLLRSEESIEYDTHTVTDLTLDTLDFIGSELHEIEAGNGANEDSSKKIRVIKNYISELKGEPKKRGRTKKETPPEVANYYIASEPEAEIGHTFGLRIYYSDDCVMENVRSFTLMNNLKEMAMEIKETPTNLLEADEATVQKIKEEGFLMTITTMEEQKAFEEYLTGYPYVKKFEFEDVLNQKMEQNPDLTDSEIDELVKEYADELLPDEEEVMNFDIADDDLDSLMLVLDTAEEQALEEKLQEQPAKVVGTTIEQVSEQVQQGSAATMTVEKAEAPNKGKTNSKSSSNGNSNVTMISVNVNKLDKLMDLVGELVVSEAMVTRNNVMAKVIDETLNKAIRQHRKIITDMQDVAMSVRMVPLSATFQKMKRIVRDVSKNLDKKIVLKLIGETTEADKNIIEKISDPLMHLIRNACDHGIEIPEERVAAGKSETGFVTLEARNSGGDILILVKDDGKGLDADRIYNKAMEKNMITKEMPRPSDEDLYNYIFMAGFSTKEQVSNYSGRGVGMDVVTQNIEKIGGSISVQSEKGNGSTIAIKIPLTLTIVEGMRLRVSDREFIIPITAIKESFKVKKENYVVDPEGNEMILIRGSSYSLLRLYKQYGIPHEEIKPSEGIVIFIGDESKQICLLADELIGEQQVVVKPLPKYLNRVQGLSGCAILGDGGISLILDMDGLLRLL